MAINLLTHWKLSENQLSFHDLSRWKIEMSLKSTTTQRSSNSFLRQTQGFYWSENQGMIGWEKLMFSDEFSSILAKFEAFLTLFLLSLDGRSEYWDAIAIMEYKDRANFCRMVSLNSLCFPVTLVIFYFFICFIFGRFSAMSGARCWNTRSLVWQTLTHILRRRFQDWLECPF